MTSADRIWNRATGTLPHDAGEGDAALHDALLFHGAAMNGGVLHAFEVLDATELEAARDGFAWLGLEPVAAFLNSTADAIVDADWDDLDAVDELETSTDDGYASLVPDDATLEDAFVARLAESPEAFAAL